jgi:Peptidase family M28
MNLFLRARIALVAGAALVAAAPARAQAPAVSPDSILATARVLSGETGLGPASRMARRNTTAVYAAYLRDRLAQALAPLGGTAALEAYDPGLDDGAGDSVRSVYTNVVGRIPGSAGGAPGVFVVGAHFDATAERDWLETPGSDPLTGDAPGADDNASGVGSILEAVRVAGLRGLRPQADVLVVFFDGEERQYRRNDQTGVFEVTNTSRTGSAHLADSLVTAGREIYGVVVEDMVSYNPRVDSLVAVTNTPSRWLANRLLEVQADSARTGLAGGLQLTRLVKGLSNSDHGPFWERGQDGIMISEAAPVDDVAGAHYHRALDRLPDVYPRGGSQAAKAAELMLALFESWSWTSAQVPPDLALTGEDLFVRDTIAVDLSTVTVGLPYEVEAGVTNRGGTETGSWSLSVEIRSLDGRLIESLGSRPVTEPIPAGGRVRVRVPWIPSARDAGAVQVTARVDPPDGAPRTATHLVSVTGAEAAVAESYVFPNPTHDPAAATIRYSLSRPGPVRVGILTLRGRLVAERDFPYDAAVPGPNVDVGAADVPLSSVLRGATLAPGLYLVRIELFLPAGGSAAVAVSRFVVVR